jgi:SAM-dependent methyltransferase
VPEHPVRAGDYRQRFYERYVSDYVAHAYRLDPAVYEQQARAFRWRLKGYLPADRGSRIADVGCGRGEFLYCLRQLGYTAAVGVDTSEEQLALARELGLAVERGDAFDFLRAHPRSFDLVTGFDLIEHFRKEEILEFLELAAAALVPGGRIVLQTPNAHSLFGARLRYADFTHEVGLTPLSLTTVLRMSGFEGVSVLPVGPVPHGVISAARYVAWSAISAGLGLLHRIETGSPGDGVFTQVMIATATTRPGAGP